MEYPELLQILKTIPVLSDVDDDDLISPIKKVEVKLYPRDSEIEFYGIHDSYFYIIKSGKIKLTRNLKGEEISKLMYPDNIFGELILNNENYDKKTAYCVTDAELFVFKKADFSHILYL